MHIEIITIGDEILNGKTLNTNFTYIANLLKKNGYIVNQGLTISDGKKEIETHIKESFERSNLIIVTGGLGPTIDDNTKKYVSQLFDIELEINEDVLKFLKEKFKNLSSIEDQSTYPKSSILLKNEIGSAFGFIIEKNNKSIMFLPGVPEELTNMFEKHAMEYIKKTFVLEKKFFQKKMNIILKEEVEINDFLKPLSTKDIILGIYPNHEIVNITISTYAKNESEANLKIDPIKKIIEEKFKSYTFENSSMEAEIHKLFLDGNKTLSFAESCSGGALSCKITAVAGSSKYFLGSFITYSNELKKNILKVKASTLNEFGAVSLQTVKEMLFGCIDLTNSSYSIAISGVAGPAGGTKDKPVGTVCIAIGDKKDFFLKEFHFQGNRNVIVKRAVSTALGILIRKIKFNKYYEL
ncbi:MAG: Nicotinamide-nucleotide amidohydrolase PncC [Candidatus Anoxychlamydiales bacterium]|nr:Nicotinamide-nucleotide amidohydrolase PncC [Candidatus Anoxychlamydiales bacterium]